MLLHGRAANFLNTPRKSTVTPLICIFIYLTVAERVKRGYGGHSCPGLIHSGSVNNCMVLAINSLGSSHSR